jgi:hypothetical protein
MLFACGKGEIECRLSVKRMLQLLKTIERLKTQC